MERVVAHGVRMVNTETPGSIREHLIAQMARAIDNSEPALVEQLLNTRIVGVKEDLEKILLKANLGELTPNQEHELEIQAQLMKLEKLHHDRVMDPNYGRGGNNRPILKH